MFIRASGRVLRPRRILSPYLRNKSTNRIEIWFVGRAEIDFSDISVGNNSQIEILWRFEFFEKYL